MNNNRDNIKKMIDASVLTSVFIVLTLISSFLGIGFMGYYDFFVPIFFVILSFRCKEKYTVLSLIVSFLVLMFVLGNLIASIMILQGALIGIVSYFVIKNLNSFEDELFFISIICLVSLFIFDIILRTFTSVSIVDSFSSVSKEFSSIIDSMQKNASGENMRNILDAYKSMINSSMFRQIFNFTFSTMSFGTAIIIYYFSMILCKKINIDLEDKNYKKYMIKKNNKIFIVSSTKPVFLGMLIYILFAEFLKIIGFKIGIEYVDTFIFALEYICAIFLFKDSFVLISNIILVKTEKKANVTLLKVGVLIIFLLNVKVAFLLLLIAYILMDRRFQMRYAVNKYFYSRIEN